MVMIPRFLCTLLLITQISANETIPRLPDALMEKIYDMNGVLPGRQFDAASQAFIRNLRLISRHSNRHAVLRVPLWKYRIINHCYDAKDPRFGHELVYNNRLIVPTRKIVSDTNSKCRSVLRDIFLYEIFKNTVARDYHKASVNHIQFTEDDGSANDELNMEQMIRISIFSAQLIRNICMRGGLEKLNAMTGIYGPKIRQAPIYTLTNAFGTLSLSGQQVMPEWKKALECLRDHAKLKTLQLDFADIKAILYDELGPLWATIKRSSATLQELRIINLVTTSWPQRLHWSLNDALNNNNMEVLQLYWTEELSSGVGDRNDDSRENWKLLVELITGNHHSLQSLVYQGPGASKICTLLGSNVSRLSKVENLAFVDSETQRQPLPSLGRAFITRLAQLKGLRRLVLPGLSRAELPLWRSIAPLMNHIFISVACQADHYEYLLTAGFRSISCYDPSLHRVPLYQWTNTDRVGFVHIRNFGKKLIVTDWSPIGDFFRSALSTSLASINEISLGRVSAATIVTIASRLTDMPQLESFTLKLTDKDFGPFEILPINALQQIIKHSQLKSLILDLDTSKVVPKRLNELLTPLAAKPSTSPLEIVKLVVPHVESHDGSNGITKAAEQHIETLLGRKSLIELHIQIGDRIFERK